MRSGVERLISTLFASGIHRPGAPRRVSAPQTRVSAPRHGSGQFPQLSEIPVEFAVSPAKLSPSKGMAQPIFPARQKSRGDIRSSETCPRFRRSPPRRPPVSRCRRRRHRYRQRRQRPVDRVPTTPTAFQKNATSEVCATQQEQRSGWRHCHYHRCAGQRLCRRLHLLRRFPGHPRRRAAQERRPDQPCGGHGSRSRPSSSA